ncbi:hypothetical protein GX51_03299 [Blastomyces parvus]|uniref:Uncharacterized protein n=1 Tax=Blastomyces parvus TaxID=2060905 RepID=A0A2B7X7Q8_9EURO|nr:hypothetical protein GX51_03299 [Blastomyces parvus]
MHAFPRRKSAEGPKSSRKKRRWWEAKKEVGYAYDSWGEACGAAKPRNFETVIRTPIPRWPFNGCSKASNRILGNRPRSTKIWPEPDLQLGATLAKQNKRVNAENLSRSSRQIDGDSPFPSSFSCRFGGYPMGSSGTCGNWWMKRFGLPGWG